MAKDLLLEIGTEEVPAHFMPGILAQLKEKATAKFQEMRLDFDEVKEDLMYEILYSKFSQNEVLLSKLLDTGTRLLADENEYKDCVDVGKVLMQVREELKTQRKV